MELSQKSMLDRYIDSIPQETETYITHCLVGESDLSPDDAESAIESLLIGEGGGGSVTSTDRYLLREWKSLAEWLCKCSRNSYPIRKEYDNGPYKYIRGRFTRYAVDGETHIVIICRFKPTPADHDGTKKSITDLKAVTVDDPDYFFMTKLRSNGWQRPSGSG